jgi:hypothetical protein
LIHRNYFQTHVQYISSLFPIGSIFESNRRRNPAHGYRIIGKFLNRISFSKNGVRNFTPFAAERTYNSVPVGSPLKSNYKKAKGIFKYSKKGF